jgi:hypothetical protein
VTFWRDLGYPVGALLAGMLTAMFGMASAVFVAAALTFTSGLVAASLMTQKQRHTTESNDDRHLRAWSTARG